MAGSRYFGSSRHGRRAESERSSYLVAVDVALAVLLCLAPLFLGGRYAIGRFVYVGLIAVAGIAWSLHVCFDRPAPLRRTAATWIFGAAFLLVVVQLAPLSRGTLSAVSPAIAKYLPLWSADAAPADPAESDTSENLNAVRSPTNTPSPPVSGAARLGQWSRISLAPQATFAALAMLAAYCILFFVVRGRIRSVTDVYWALGLIAATAVVFAAVGLVQFASGTDRYLGIYEHPFRSAEGAATASFYNNNHFAHLLALGVGPLVAWLAIATAGDDRTTAASTWNPARRGSRADLATRWLKNPMVALTCLGVVLFAVLSSLSRGGTLVVVISISVTALILFSRKALPRKVIGALAVSGALVGVAIAVHGFERITARMDTLTSGTLEEMDRYGFRRDIWAANMEAFREFWRTGIGVGAHRYVLPAYLKKSYSIDLTHAESGYLQIASESGVIGIALCAAVIGLCGYWCITAWRGANDKRFAAAVAAVTAGIVASVVHSIWDFVWYIPATMATTIVLAACASRLKDFATADANVAPARIRHTPAMAWATSAAMLGASIWMLGDRAIPALASHSWDSYLRTSVAVREEARRAARNSEVETVSYETEVARTDAMLRDLQDVVARNPNDGLAHLRFAAHCLVRFELAQQKAENNMPISQIRMAAVASQFPSRAALNVWLSKAIGDSRNYLDFALVHARRSVRLCPFQSEGYLLLADLSFLDVQDDVSALLLDQARRVNPNDGEVLIRTGVEAFAAYDFERGQQCWRQAYDSGNETRTKLLGICAGRMPVLAILDMFDPDIDTLRNLEWRYMQLDAPTELETLRRFAVTQVVAAAEETDGVDAGKLWYRACRLHQEIDQPAEAILCAERAAENAEHDFDIRAAVGRYLLSQHHFAEAERHLAWCVARRSTDATLVRDLTAAKTRRLHESAARKTAVSPRSPSDLKNGPAAIRR